MTTHTIDSLTSLAAHVARAEADAACRDDDTRDPATLAAGVARVTLEAAGLPTDADTVARFDRLLCSRIDDELASSWWAPAPDLAEQLLEEHSPGFGRDPMLALLWGMVLQTPPGEYGDAARRFVADALARWRAAHPGRQWPTSQAHLDETAEALESMLEHAEPWLSYDHVFEVWADDETPSPGTGQTRHAVAVGRMVLGEETGLARRWLASARVGEEGVWAGMFMRRIA